MKKQNIKLFKFSELDFSIKRKILDKNLNKLYLPLIIINDILKYKFNEDGFNLIKIKININPFYFEGLFNDGVFEYMISKEEDSTKFYSNKFVEGGSYMVSLKNIENDFIQSYLKIYQETKNLIMIIKNTLEDYIFNELTNNEKEIYLKEGIAIKQNFNQEDEDYVFE
jgi:hypothetical protein